MKTKYGFIRASLDTFKKLSDPAKEAILRNNKGFQTIEIDKGGKGKKVVNESLIAHRGKSRT